MPARLKPTAPIAAEAILVGDPGRALMLAQELLQQPKMSNHARGLWGYTGSTAAGRELTVQSTGMGGPSATVVLRDLAELGVQRAIRIGTGVGLRAHGLGELVIVTGAQELRGRVPAEPVGAVHPSLARPDRGLTSRLEAALADAAPGLAVSLDDLHDPEQEAPSLAADVADMQTAAVLAAAAALGVAAAAVLVITTGRDRATLPDEALEEAARRAGRAAATALSP